MRRLLPFIFIVLFALAACEGSSRLLPANGSGEQTTDTKVEVEVSGTPSDMTTAEVMDPSDTLTSDVPQDTTNDDTTLSDTTDPSDAIADVTNDTMDAMDAMGGANCDCGPRWTLEDSAGVAVDALIDAPSWGGGNTFNTTTPGVDITQHPNKCVSILDLDGFPTHGALYSLSTGLMVDCYDTASSDMLYQDVNCNVPIIEVGPRVTFMKVGSAIKGAWGTTSDIPNLQTVYTKLTPSSCNMLNLPDPKNFWTFKDLPPVFPQQITATLPLVLSVSR